MKESGRGEASRVNRDREIRGRERMWKTNGLRKRVFDRAFVRQARVRQALRIQLSLRAKQSITRAP
jgi:hypothetical protein